MSIFKTYEIDIDTMKETQVSGIVFNQGDLNTAKLIIRILHDGEVLNLSGFAVRLALMKVDGKRVYQDCEIVDAGQGLVEVILTTQSLTAVGQVEGELSLSFGGNKKMITTKFVFKVEKSIMNSSAIKSMNDLSVIERALDLAESLGQVNLEHIANVSETINEFSSELDETKEDLMSRGYNILNFILPGETTHADAFQRANDVIRALALTTNISKVPSLKVPTGTYVIDKTVKMSPYVKMISEGLVRFNVTYDGIAFHIVASADDPRYNTQSIPSRPDYVFNKQGWNRGKYFDGSNGGFLFTTQLDRETSNTVALAIGRDDYTTQDDMRATSRYFIEQVNIFGFNTAIRHFGIDNYIGTFEGCHLEGNHVNIHWVTPTPNNTRLNGGENQVYKNCLFATSTSHTLRVDGAGADFTFENCSFDFLRAPLFQFNQMGTLVRVNNAHIEGTHRGPNEPNAPLLLEVNNPSTASQLNIINERNQFLMKNCISMTSQPDILFHNNPNPTSGARIKLILDLDGVESRYGARVHSTPYELEKRFICRPEDNIQFYSNKLYNVTLLKSGVSPNLNLLSNHDFSKSTDGTDFSTEESDQYWKVVHQTNVADAIISENEGISGTKCLKYNVTTPNSNSLRLVGKQMVPVEAGEVIITSLAFKTDVINNTAQIIHRLICFDSAGLQTEVLSFHDYLTDTETNVENDPTKFRMTRATFGLHVIPAGVTHVKTCFSFVDMPGTVMFVDDLYLAKMK